MTKGGPEGHLSPLKGESVLAQSPMSLTIRLPYLPSRELSGNKRPGWAGTHRLRLEEQGLWLLRLREALGPPPWPTFEGLAEVTICVTGTGERIDPDNWVAGNDSLKVLMDCLTARSGFGMGILPDDSPSHIRAYHAHISVDGEEKTTILIKEVEGGDTQGRAEAKKRTRNPRSQTEGVPRRSRPMGSTRRRTQGDGI